MARKSKKAKKVSAEQSVKTSNQIKWPESYTSLILGVIVVIVIALLMISFIRSRKTEEISSDKTTNEAQKTAEANITIHTVSEGEDLWQISEKYYNDGYKWVEIAKANNLTNPDLIEKGSKIKIPKLEQQTISAEIKETIVSPSVGQENGNTDQSQNSQVQLAVTNSIKGNSYVVGQGEFLWDIAVRAYGDGFKWVEIAKANNISNPDYIIFTGDVLKIPR